MPNLDKTGPKGNGPKTGRGQGDCQEGSDVPGRVGRVGRAGPGRRQRGDGTGRGRSFGRRSS